MSAEVPIGVLEVPVGVWGSRRVELVSGLPGRLEVFSEETCTVIVFPHGAVIRLSMAIEPGQKMMVINRKSGQQVFCRVVSVRKYQSVRGYAEIEFIQPIDAFWGPYIPQGTMKLTEKAKLPATKLGEAPKTDRIAQVLASFQSSIENSFTSIPESLPPISKPLENFYRSDFPPQKPSAVTTIADASAELPKKVRTMPEPVAACQAQTAQEAGKSPNEPPASPPFWALLASWLKPRIHTRDSSDKVHSSTYSKVLVGATVAGFCLICASWIHHSRNRTPTEDAATQTSPIVPASNLQGLQSERSSEPAVPLPFVAANTEGFPGTQTPKYADNFAKAHLPARKSASEGEITNKRLLPPHWTARSSKAIGLATPPDVAALSLHTGKDPVEEFLVGSQPVGRRMKEPQLVSKFVPTYPSAARQFRVEGNVTVEAVIDTDGKLTDMKVISGPLLLQPAALESLRNWKYRPAYVDDKPVPTKTSITLEFRLN